MHRPDPSEPPTDLHRSMMETARRALSARPGVELDFEEAVIDYPGSYSVIIRCRSGSGGDLPARVILKRPRTPTGHQHHDWISLSFLHDVPGVRPLVPRLYAVDPGSGLSVMEDLGPAGGRLLGEILEGGDAGRAGRGLEALARTMGEVHAGAAPLAGAFDAVRRRYPAGGRSRHRVHTIGGALESVPRNLALIGVELPRTARADLRTAFDEVRDPGPFATWVHGDWTPANAFYHEPFDPERVRFFDFEASGWRHALLDGSYFSVRWIHSVWARSIPAPVLDRGASLYRAALARGIPEAGDDDRYHRAETACAAGWMAGLLCFLPQVMDADHRWGRSTNRQRIVTALEHHAALSSRTGALPDLGEAASAAAAVLRARWPEPDCTMATHRAFRE